MKVLFVLHLFSHTRHFHTVFQELLARGHSLEVVGLNRLSNQGPTVQAPVHAKHIRPVSYSRLPNPRTDFWGGYVEALRASRNALLYSHPCFRDATVFRDRAVGLADPFLKRFLPASGKPPAAWLSWFYRTAEAAIPPDPAVVQFLAERRPDVMLVSPLISHEMPMLHEHVKAAHVLGIPVGFPVFSWDNFTTKGTIHELPDRVFVWNDIQKREAIELHGCPAERIEVLGGWRFDEFLAMRPTTDRAAFCDAHGFDPQERIVLYIGSSPIVAPTEVDFVTAWLSAVRSAPDETLRRANVLVRPHPRNLKAWQGVTTLGGYERVSFENIEGLSLFEAQSLYDDICHSDAVLGLVTSAMLEAALLGKPVHTVLTTLAGEGQSGTVHFEYLNTAGGGLLYLARTLEEHVALLASHLNRPSGEPDRRASAFARAFIGAPEGSKSASEALAAAIERLAGLHKSPRLPGLHRRCMEVILKAALRNQLLPIRKNPQLRI